MNNVRNIFIVSVALLTSAFVTSCRETNDWGDSEYSSPTGRMFSVTGSKITVTAEDTQAEVTFTAVPDASHYIIEISRDSLYDDIQLGGTATSVIFGQDKSITKSPAKLTNLAGDTRYFLRLKAMSDSRTESKWSYYQKSNVVTTFKTKSEQIFQEPVASDRDENKIRVSWDATKEVTNILVLDGNDNEIQNITLDAAAKAAGEYTVTGLTPSTIYVFKIMNGTDLRGTLKIATTAAMPTADFKYTLADDVTVITSTLLADIATQAQAVAEDPANYSATIGIPAGITIDFHGTAEDGGNTNVVIPDGMAVTFFGMSGGDTPTIKFQKNIDIAGTHAYIAFENVKVVDNGAGYFLNQSTSCSVGEFRIKDCEMSGFGTSFFRFQKADAKNINKVTVTNSIFHDMCSGYSFFHIDADKGNGGGVKNIAMDKCTLYNIATGGKMFIYSRDTDMESISVKNTTFYNCIGNGNYWVDFDKNGKGCTGTYEFVNCLFTKTPDEANNKNVRGATDPVFADCKKTTDFFKVFPGVEELYYNAAALFTDPANGDLKMKIDLNCGDPRWFMTEE